MPVNDDVFNLKRFTNAQSSIYASVCAELASGRKLTHWMWFIFPQLKALGSSDTARFYGLSGLTHARAYWNHELLGPRLQQCTELVLAARSRTAAEIFGSPDDPKLRSCATLFAEVTASDSAFRRILSRFYEGKPDPLTLRHLLKSAGADPGVNQESHVRCAHPRTQFAQDHRAR